MHEDMEEMIDEALDLIADIASKWQGDNATDEIARAIIGSSNPIFHVMEKLVRDDEYTPNIHVMQILVKLSYTQIMAIKELDSLAELKGGE